MSQPTSTSVTDPTVVTITTYEEAKDAYRQKSLRQALYDAGEVVMGDVLVNLHASEHRDRRRLENRLFRRETFELYERHLFPPIIEATLASMSMMFFEMSVSSCECVNIESVPLFDCSGFELKS